MEVADPKIVAVTHFLFCVDRRHTEGQAACALGRFGVDLVPVSYTHLDVYKRQVLASLTNSLKAFGIDWILIKNRNNVAVDTTKFYCDYYLSLIHI